MKKLLAILIAFAMLFSLAACGGETAEDPNAGKYLGTTAKAMGMTMEMSDIYPGETWLELKSGGKGTIMLDGESFPMKWSLEGDTFTLTIDGEDSVGTLSEGMIVVDLMDMGVEMTFLKEGMEPPAPAVTYNDAGYWEVIRIDSDDPEARISEEDMMLVKQYGVLMYMELFEDGTGILFMDEAMPITWQDGAVTFTEDAMTVAYTLENNEMVLDMYETVFVMRKGEKPAEPAPVISELEAAGFTEFMELGVPYTYTNQCYENEEYDTTGEAMVVSYEIFDSADGYEATEGYEWRVVVMEIRFFDNNAWDYGIMAPATNCEDYYNVALHDDTNELIYESDTYDQYCYTVIHEGQEMDAYAFLNANSWSEWTTDEAGNHETICTLMWDFLVPVGYDGCVVGIRNRRVEWPEDAYITDMNPDDFLLFRLN